MKGLYDWGDNATGQLGDISDEYQDKDIINIPVKVTLPLFFPLKIFKP
ncbi:MAG: hypothetical protein ABI045_02695 [Flavobacteriales bacterium]